MSSDNTIYILGAGTLGSLVAYELASTEPDYGIVFLYRDEDKVERFAKSGSLVTIHRAPDNINVSAKVKASCPSLMKAGNKQISNLIVTTKTYQVESALSPYLSMISPESNILFIQNGLGVLEILHEKVWLQEESRPVLFQGVTNHGGFKTPNVDDEFQFTHAGYGDLKVAQISLNNDLKSVEKVFIISELLKPKVLNTIVYEYPELLVVQVEKFVVNACINSVTSILDCINGELGPLDTTRELFQSIISECIAVFSKTMPSLLQTKSSKEILDVERLVTHTIHVGTVVNKENSSSMHEDTLHLRDTEVDFINGFVVSSAESVGLKADVNKTITLLVKARLALNRDRAN